MSGPHRFNATAAKATARSTAAEDDHPFSGVRWLTVAAIAVATGRPERAVLASYRAAKLPPADMVRAGEPLWRSDGPIAARLAARGVDPGAEDRDRAEKAERARAEAERKAKVSRKNARYYAKHREEEVARGRAKRAAETPAQRQARLRYNRRYHRRRMKDDPTYRAAVVQRWRNFAARNAQVPGVIS